jgi:hypothetical protein
VSKPPTILAVREVRIDPVAEARNEGPRTAEVSVRPHVVRMEEEYDAQLKEAHTLAKSDPARPILAAGLYSESEECQGKPVFLWRRGKNGGRD